MSSLFSSLGFKPPPFKPPPSASSQSSGSHQSRSDCAHAPESNPSANTPDPSALSSSTSSSPGLFSNLSENPLFTGGLAIGAITASLQILRKSSTRAASLLRRQLLITVEVPSTDSSYDWFLHYLAAHHAQKPLGRPPLFSLARFRPAPRELTVDTRTVKSSSGETLTNITLVPGQGRHIVNYNSTLLSITRERDTRRSQPNGEPYETLQITTLYSQRHVLTSLLKASQELAAKRDEGKTIVYKSYMTDWKQFGLPRAKRPLESVILNPGVKERLLSDLQDFLASREWYRSRGIPYRRGYLLHGPPGTGKTSIVQALAGELDYNICLINLSERGMTDDRLQHLLSNLPERSLALLEDCDAAFVNRRARTEDGYSGASVTFSGLLNALDGVASGEERIMMLTTNHRDILDAALVRPGRVDLDTEIGYVTTKSVSELWDRFYSKPSTDEDTVDPKTALGHSKSKKLFIKELKWGGCLEEPPRPGMGVSAAELQAIFVFYKGSPSEAVEGVRALVAAKLYALRSRGYADALWSEMEEAAVEDEKGETDGTKDDDAPDRDGDDGVMVRRINSKTTEVDKEDREGIVRRVPSSKQVGDDVLTIRRINSDAKEADKSKDKLERRGGYLNPPGVYTGR